MNRLQVLIRLQPFFIFDGSDSVLKQMRKGVAIVVITGMIINPFTRETRAQTVVFDGEITWEWPISGNIFGGYSFYWWHRLDGITMPDYGEMSPTDWTSPDNYYAGQFRLRFEVLEQPTDEPFEVQFGIWQDLNKGEAYPLTVGTRVVISRGTVFEGSIGSPANWYNKESGDRVDFSRPEDFFRMGLVLWNPDPLCIPQGTDWDPNGCPEHADKFFPMRARLKITAYASGEICPPSYSVDYGNERTKEQILPEDQWSRDSVEWTDGSNETLSLTPGQDIYFRKKEDPSKIQILDVKERPGVPGFTIDYIYERTAETVSNAYWYSASIDMSGAYEGTGSHVDLLPGTTVYFQARWTYIAFRSEIQVLNLPMRPAITTEEGDTTVTGPFTVSFIFFQKASNLTIPGITAVNATVDGLQLVSALETSTLYHATVSPLAGGTVSLQVKANEVDEGNFASESFQIHYMSGNGSGEFSRMEQLVLFPNPTTGRFKVSSALLEQTGSLVEIFSITGKQLISKQPLPGADEMDLLLGQLDRGIYLLKLSSGSGIVTGKVILLGH
jgi:hypothetical protein